MKTRTGFVSNSSSSSFIVERTNYWAGLNNEVKLLISPEQETLLEKHGFRKAFVFDPSEVPSFYDDESWKKEEKLLKEELTEQDFLDGEKMELSREEIIELHEKEKQSYSWCYSVMCNQDDIICFLIKNKIPFVASVHYDYQTYFYYPEEDKLVMSTNFGNILLMYRKTKLEKFTQWDYGKPPVEITTGKEYVQKNDYYSNSDYLSEMQ